MVPRKYIEHAEKEAIGRQFTPGRTKEAWIADYAAQLAREAGWRANDAWLANHSTPAASRDSGSSSSSSSSSSSAADEPERREESTPQFLPSAAERERARLESQLSHLKAYGDNRFERQVESAMNGARMMHGTMMQHNPSLSPFEVRQPNPEFKAPETVVAQNAPPAPLIVPAYHGHRHRPQPQAPAQAAPQAPTMPAINPALARSLTIQMPSEQSFGGNQVLQMLLGNAGGGGGGFSGGDWGIPQQVPVRPRMSTTDRILRHFAQSMYHPEEYPEEGE